MQALFGTHLNVRDLDRSIKFCREAPHRRNCEIDREVKSRGWECGPLHGPSDASRRRTIPMNAGQPGEETSSPFAEGAFTPEHANDKERSHKHQECLKQVSKCSFQAS